MQKGLVRLLSGPAARGSVWVGWIKVGFDQLPSNTHCVESVWSGFRALRHVGHSLSLLVLAAEGYIGLHHADGPSRALFAKACAWSACFLALSGQVRQAPFCRVVWFLALNMFSPLGQNGKALWLMKGTKALPALHRFRACTNLKNCARCSCLPQLTVNTSTI